MFTFSQIKKFDVGLEFIKGGRLPDETETIVAFHTLIQAKNLAIH